MSRRIRAPVRWGIVGCGNVTEVKSGPAFQQAKDSDLVAVMRRNGGLAADYARRHGVPRWYDDADALIDDPEVDAVYIATPPGSHLEHALRVCRAGKPVYVEKPMARNHDECRRMVSAFRDARLPLFVAYYRRGLARFVKVKQLVDEGALGTIASVSIRLANRAQLDHDPTSPPWRLQPAQSGGGLLLDVGSHALDLVDFLLGPLEHVGGVAANRSGMGVVEDTVALSFRAGGIPGVGLWDFSSPARQDTLEITGTEGRLVVSVFGQEPIRWERTTGVEEIPAPVPPHIQLPLIQSVVDALLGRGSCPSTGESGARASLVMDKALETYYGGRDDAFWERSASLPGFRPDAPREAG